MGEERPRGPITLGREAKRTHHMGERGQEDASYGGERSKGPITWRREAKRPHHMMGRRDQEDPSRGGGEAKRCRCYSVVWTRTLRWDVEV